MKNLSQKLLPVKQQTIFQKALELSEKLVVISKEEVKARPDQHINNQILAAYLGRSGWYTRVENDVNVLYVTAEVAYENITIKNDDDARDFINWLIDNRLGYCLGDYPESPLHFEVITDSQFTYVQHMHRELAAYVDGDEFLHRLENEELGRKYYYGEGLEDEEFPGEDVSV